MNNRLLKIILLSAAFVAAGLGGLQGSAYASDDVRANVVQVSRHAHHYHYQVWYWDHIRLRHWRYGEFETYARASAECAGLQRLGYEAWVKPVLPY